MSWNSLWSCRFRWWLSVGSTLRLTCFDIVIWYVVVVIKNKDYSHFKIIHSWSCAFMDALTPEICDSPAGWRCANTYQKIWVWSVWLWESRGPWSLEGNGDIEVKTKCRNSWSCTTTLPQEQKQHPGYSELTSRRDPTFPNTVCSHRANSSHRPPVGLLHWRAAYSHFDFFTFYLYCSSFFRYFLVIFVSILADVIKDVT